MSVTTTGMRHITAANLAEVTGPSQASSQEALEGIARHAEAASLYAGAGLVAKRQRRLRLLSVIGSPSASAAGWQGVCDRRVIMRPGHRPIPCPCGCSPRLRHS